MKRYADLFVRHRRAAAILAALATVLAALGATRLGFDDLPRGVIRSDDAPFALLSEVQAQFGADDNDVVLVMRRDQGWFTPPGVRALRAAEQGVRAIPGVERVDGLASLIVLEDGVPRPLLPADGAGDADLAAARERARAHPLAGGNLISDDGRTALAVARLAGGDLTIEDLRAPLAALRATAARLARDHGVRARVTGVPAFREVIFRTIRRDQVTFTALGALVCFLIALALLKSVRACLVASLPPLCGALWVLGAIGLAGGEIDLLGTVLPVLCILVGFTDSVHLVSDVQNELALGRTHREAVRHALATLGTPCFLTSITTAIGLGSLSLGSVPMIRHFGAQGAAGVLIAFAAVMTTLPLAALLLRPEPRAVDRGSARVVGLLRAAIRRPRRVVALGAAATLAMGALSLTLSPDNRLTEAVPHDAEVFAALRDVEQAFGGILPLYALVEWDRGRDPLDPDVLAGVRAVEAVLAREPRLSRPYSYAGAVALAGGGPAALLGARAAALAAARERGLLRDDLARALVVARLPDLGSAELAPLLARVEAGLAEVEARHPAIEVALTGTDVVARRNVNRMIADLVGGLSAATVLIFLVIALELRSLKLGLLSLLPNAFPLACVGALLVALGRPLQMTSAVLFTLLLGLAVDDTIHLLSRYRRERALGGDPRDAILRAGSAVGAPILATTIVLAGGFCVLFASSVPTNRLFGLLLIAGLLAALIGDLLILPASLALAERRRDQPR